jgi:hypothetical protein
VPEYAFFIDEMSSTFDGVGSTGGGDQVDTNPQPYVEVFPDDPRYDDAIAASKQRLALLHDGIAPPAPAPDASPDAAPPSQGLAAGLVPVGSTTRAYSRWADPGETDDILDPAVVADPICNAIPAPPPNTTTLVGGSIPAHCHWVITDATQPPGDWSPRRPDWATALANNMPSPDVAQCGMPAASAAAAQLDEETAVTFLQNLEPLANVTTTLTTPTPFGLWVQKPGCDFKAQPTADSFTGASRPTWMGVAGVHSEPVFSQTAGQAVFKMICINCHGPQADSTGRLAQNLATMTGGLAQVADFRDGLFGKVGTTYSDIQAVFGPTAGLPSSWTLPQVTPFDRAARYMAWMALGGTKVKIPDGILQIVSLTKVLDKPRLAAPAGQKISANMLSTAKGLCTALLGCQLSLGEVCAFNPNNVTSYSKTLIHTNGDAELWLKLCSLNNPPPIHIIKGGNVDTPFDPNTGQFVVNPNQDLYEPQGYPAGQPLGGNASHTQGPDNPWPWCISQFDDKPPPGSPICAQGTDFTADDAEKWAVRGAINAGLAVFLYVKSLEQMPPPPDYDQCEQLP